jgi:hypothetical protein
LLLRLTSHVLSTGKSYYVASPKGVRLSEPAEAVRCWLAGQFSEAEGLRDVVGRSARR